MNLLDKRNARRRHLNIVVSILPQSDVPDKYFYKVLQLILVKTIDLL